MLDIKKFKNTHIGQLIKARMLECSVTMERACSFLKVPKEDINQMLCQKSLDCDILLLWSKLLRYDFFRIYSQHLILYAPPDPNKTKRSNSYPKTSLPVFKKNIYTQEVITYLIELVESGKKTCKQIQKEYNIPSTTVARWMDKYGKNENSK